jgi:hypothetical protein
MGLDMFGFSITEILPHVYHLHFESSYDLAMHFLRFQEYYESAKFHRQIFSLVDYMEWYSRDSGEGSFTYAGDWSGFNVPSWVLLQVRQAEIPDPNKYDRFMFNLVDWINQKEFPNSFYFIGTSSAGYRGDESESNVLAHEVAHALYTVKPEYKQEVERILHEWQHSPGRSGEQLDSAVDVLTGMGYHQSVIMDEIHAYCATGLCDELESVISDKEQKPFRKLFQEYKKKCILDASK